MNGIEPLGTLLLVAVGFSHASPHWVEGWPLALGLALINFLWQAAIVGGALGLFLAGSGRFTARARYGLSCVALFSLPAWFGATLLWAHAHPFGSAAIGGVGTGWRAALLASTDVWLPGLAAAWALGVAGMAVYSAGGWLLVQRTRRRVESSARVSAISAAVVSARLPEDWQRILARLCRRMRFDVQPVLALAERLTSPCVVGLWRPIILFPLSAVGQMDPHHVEAILAHELAHIARHDAWVNLPQRGVEVLFFFHPMVWWISRQVEQEREQSCDELAIEVCGDRLRYARALVEFAALPPSNKVLSGAARSWACAASGGSLRRRVRRLLGLQEPTRPCRRAVSVFGCALVLALALGWAGLRPGIPSGEPAPATTIAATARPVLTHAKRPAVAAAPRPSPARAEPWGTVAAAPRISAVHEPQTRREATPNPVTAAAPEPGSRADFVPAPLRRQTALVAFSFTTVESCTSRYVLVRQVGPGGLTWIEMQPELSCVPVLQPTGVWVLTT